MPTAINPDLARRLHDRLQCLRSILSEASSHSHIYKQQRHHRLCGRPSSTSIRPALPRAL